MSRDPGSKSKQIVSIRHGRLLRILRIVVIFVAVISAGSMLLRHSSAVAAPSDAIEDASLLVPNEPLTNTLFVPYIPGKLLFYLPLIVTPSPTFTPLYPPDRQTDQSPNANLIWDVQPKVVDIGYYRVYLEADDSTPNTLIAETTTPYFDPPTFALNTIYFWRIGLVDQTGREHLGPVWIFHTEGPFDGRKLGTMVTVPSGEFQMGCDWDNPYRPKACWGQEIPLHPVYLDAYEIDKYEITNREYRACVESGACDLPRKLGSRDRDSYFDNPIYDNHPVLFVSWWDAGDYCSWVGKRRPTEAEWEKAARGSIDTRSWPWGNEPIDCSRANYTNNTDDNNWLICVDETTSVGMYPTGASPYGAMDMAGNVFEWVADAWKPNYYFYSRYDNPTGPRVDTSISNKPAFVIRGGSYRPNWFYTQTNHRHWGHHGDGVGDDSPFFRNDQVGFRCARSIESE